jgi:hypothetical protein
VSKEKGVLLTWEKDHFFLVGMVLAFENLPSAIKITPCTWTKPVNKQLVSSKLLKVYGSLSVFFEY